MAGSKLAASAMAAGIAVAGLVPDPTPPAPTAPSVNLIAGRPTSDSAWPVRMPSLSEVLIAPSISLARASGDRLVLHQGWLPQREGAAAAGEQQTRASASAAAGAHRVIRRR